MFSCRKFVDKARQRISVVGGGGVFVVRKGVGAPNPDTKPGEDWRPAWHGMKIEGLGQIIFHSFYLFVFIFGSQSTCISSASLGNMSFFKYHPD